MVRREGTRFGVTTSQNVRRLPFSYQQLHAQQSVLVETKLDAEGHHEKKQAKSALKKQMRRGVFDGRDATSSEHVMYSLNKAKRWEVIEDIKEDCEEVSDTRNIVVEHHILPRPRCHYSATRSCIGVFDSSADTVKKSPKKKYARVNELMKKEDEEAAMNEEDKDFGKKNRRRSKKKKAHQEEKAEENRAPLTTVRFDVTLAAPRQTYQTYCNPAGDSGHGKRNRNSRNRTTKLAQCNMQDVFSDGLWELEESYLGGDEEDEEEYWREETKDADPYQKCTVAIETLVNKACAPGAVYQKECKSLVQRDAGDTKGRIFPLEEDYALPYFTQPDDIKKVTKMMEKQKRRRRKKQRDAVEEEHVAEAPVPVVIPEDIIYEKPAVVRTVRTDDITSAGLEGQFGNRYMEGLSLPRRFAVNITDSVLDELRNIDGNNHNVVAMLQQTGHHIFTVVDCMLDPWLTMRRDHSLVEDIRVKVCGVKEDQEMLTNALTGLGTNEICDVVTAISHSVTALPLESYLIDRTVTSVATKPALNVETVQSVLGWQYDVTNVNKATEKTIGQQSTKNSETGEVTSPCGASNACESCGICYQEFDETCPGTALLRCSHWFCDECWRSHLIARVEHGDINITCPGFKCTSAVDKVTMMSLLPSKLYARHHGNRANTALMLQRDVHWCPGPQCGRLLRLAAGHQEEVAARGRGVVPVNCECGMFWCSECKEEAHWPATCQQAQTYRNEARTFLVRKKAEVVKVNTKGCPRCFYPIEKSYGCNHMVCKCGFDFCWDCGKPFDNGHYHCSNRNTWRFKEYILKPDVLDKSAVELAIVHHRKRTRAACHRRSRKARKLALRMKPMTSSDSDSDDTASLLSSATSASSGDERPASQLGKVGRVLADVANFLSEGEFVLEHLEILLSTPSPSNQKGVLYQHKTRLIFITEKLNMILDEEAKLDMAKVEHLLHCGKSCLRWIAVAANHLTNSLALATADEE